MLFPDKGFRFGTLFEALMRLANKEYIDPRQIDYDAEIMPYRFTHFNEKWRHPNAYEIHPVEIICLKSGHYFHFILSDLKTGIDHSFICSEDTDDIYIKILRYAE